MAGGERAGGTVTAVRDGALRRGRIVEVDVPAGTAAVLLHGPAAGASVGGCARCARGLGCQALFGPPPRATSTVCRLPAAAAGRAGYGIGCEVEVAVPDAGALALQAATLGFGVPTVALVLGSVLGEWAAGTHGPGGPGGLDGALLATLGGLSGLAIGVLASHRLLRRLARAPGARPGTDALRIVSVAATHPPAPTRSHADDQTV